MPYPGGCSNTSKIDIIDTVVDGIEAHAHSTETKVDALDVVADSTLAEVEYIEHHLHAANRTYGLDASTGNAGMGSTVPLVVTGGNNVFGTEVLLNKGTFGGTKYDPGTIQVVATGAANSPTLLEFWSWVAGSQVAYTMEADNETVTAAGHGLLDGDRVIFDTIVGGDTHGVTRAIVYWVRDMSGSTFKVALTSGGAAVEIDADLSGFIRKLTGTFATDKIVSAASTTSDSFALSLPCLKVTSTHYLSVTAKSKSGDTTSVSFFLDVHTYAA